MTTEADQYEDEFEEDFGGDTMPAAAVGAAVLAAALGAAAWAALSHYANFEVGYLAWAIGGLVGFLTVKAGGRGTPVAVLAAVLALVSIFAGKYVAAHLVTKQIREASVIEEATVADYEERQTDARDWAALAGKDNDEDVKEYLFRHSFIEGNESAEELTEALDVFRTYTVPVLEEFQADPPTAEAWLAEAQANLAEARVEQDAFIEEEFGPLQLMKEDISPLDLLFAFLGISTAFGMVSKA